MSVLAGRKEECSYSYSVRNGSFRPCTSMLCTRTPYSVSVQRFRTAYPYGLFTPCLRSERGREGVRGVGREGAVNGAGRAGGRGAGQDPSLSLVWRRVRSTKYKVQRTLSSVSVARMLPHRNSHVIGSEDLQGIHIQGLSGHTRHNHYSYFVLCLLGTPYTLSVFVCICLYLLVFCLYFACTPYSSLRTTSSASDWGSQRDCHSVTGDDEHDNETMTGMTEHKASTVRSTGYLASTRDAVVLSPTAEDLRRTCRSTYSSQVPVPCTSYVP